ncbi:oligopeptidase B [Candidatus Pantoea edessiphila]|uniref:Oligopeptidase B n=1 Tax=Candidatus Pantoea edessiphila TaxID=2044610 RepID=A0A2P5T0R5_9GAMM|nr:prolyl oligopeptidase family serine peptidase [Candidatus Pantoea edessiphila]PPI88184.1 oligopeptidase B [Candidatus Pantoea edessiphila]
MKEPFAKKIPHKIFLHGEQIVDNYYWLRDNRRNNTHVIKHLKDENNYTNAILTSQNDLKNLILKEITDHLSYYDCSIPYIKDSYCYQSRYENGSEYPKYYRKLFIAEDDKWTLILDTNKRALHSNFYSIGAFVVSPNNCLFALAEDLVSRFQYNIQFFNIKNNFWYSETLFNTSASIVWDKNSKMIFYVKNHPQTLRSYQVWCHELGTLQSKDKKIYEELDDSYYLNICTTTSEKFILILISNTISTEIRMIDMDLTDKTPQIFLARRNNHKYTLDHYNNKFIICSNRDRDNFNLYYSNNIDELGWKSLIRIHEDAILENFQLFHNWIVIEEKRNGLTNLRQINWQQSVEKNIQITFDDPIYRVWLEYNSNPLNNILLYGYTSMTTPSTIFELNMDTGKSCILKQTTIKNFDSSNYKSEYRLIDVKDGTKVPVSFIYNRKYPNLNKNPAIIYGYGAYGNNVDPYFCIGRLSFLDRGFIYVIVHVRGGGELGQKWHDSGRLFNKMNSFTDFIDVTNALVNCGIGHPNKLYAIGGSAGGLLIGTVINLAPKLFNGVVAHVPFVDVINTMLDKSIPLTTSEYDEWGNPENIDAYNYMKKYSPYDNVGPKNYPHIFVTSGFYDSQVQYWEPAKWVAKLRELKTNKNLVLLYTDMNSGHSGKTGRYKQYEITALEITFIISLEKNII